MTPALSQRLRWGIEDILESLIGHDIRVAAKSFSPRPNAGDTPPRFLPVRDLFLPDNTQPAGLPVFFEGRLSQFERQIGVVFVRLDAPSAVTASAEGTVLFRGQAAVILRGPAVLELAFPFHVERLPSDPGNYWRDLRMPRAQFELPFSADHVAGAEPPGGGESPQRNDSAGLRRGH